MLIIIIIVSAAAVHCRITTPEEDVPNPLLESLRRQLMENNYDYQSMEKAEQAKRAQTAPSIASVYSATTPEGRFRVVQARAEGVDYEINKVADEAPQFKGFEIDNVTDKTQQYKGLEFKVHDKVVGLDVLSLRDSKGGSPHFRSVLDKSFEEEKPPDVVSKTDLLYYVDENRLRRSQEPSEDFKRMLSDKTVDYEEMYPHDDDVTTPKVKYKLFKVRDRSPTRRNAPARRFLKERGSDGVAFMSLDAAPFPLFKLPRSRRQYMQDIGEEMPGTDAEDEAFLLPSAGSRQTSHEDI